MARIRQSEGGALYESERPLVVVDKPIGFGHRLPPVMEGVRVLLQSDEAERATDSPEHWGTLPAWCSRCRAERWVDLQVLRRGGRDLLLD